MREELYNETHKKRIDALDRKLFGGADATVHDGSTGHVVLDRDRLAAYVLLQSGKTPNSTHVRSLGTSPEYQGRGLATDLLKKALGKGDVTLNIDTKYHGKYATPDRLKKFYGDRGFAFSGKLAPNGNEVWVRSAKEKQASLDKLSSTRVMRELAKRVAAAGGAKAVAKNPSLVPMIDDLQRASQAGKIDQLADRQLTYLGRGSDGRASTTLGLKHPGLEVRKVPLTNPEGTRSNLSGKHPAIQDMLVRRNVAENMVLQREARGHEMVQRAYDSDPKLQKLVNIPQYRGIEYSTGNKLGNTRQQLMDVGEGGLAGLPLRNAIARTKPVSEASYRLANKHKLMHLDTHQGNVKYMDSAGKPLDKPVMFDFGRVQQVTKPITEAEIGHMAGTPFFTPKTGATPNMFGVHGSTRDTGEMQAAAGMALDKFRKGKQYVPTPPLMTPAYANAATVVQPRAR